MNDDTIDFAADGRLLAAATCAPWSRNIDDMAEEFVIGIPKGPKGNEWVQYRPIATGRLDGPGEATDADAIVAMVNHAAAYREAVLALDALTAEPSHQIGQDNGPDWVKIEADVDVFRRAKAAIARFRNITETP